MADKNLKEPLIPEPSHQKDVVKKRRFRRVKSAPLAERVPGEVDGRVPSDRGSESMDHISGWKTNDIVDALYLCVVKMTTAGYGTLYPKVEELDFVDAFYCVCCTITTLGWVMVIVVLIEGGRIFAVIWILMITICVAQFFLYLTEMHTEKRQKHLVYQVLTRQMTNVDLEAADMDDDGAVNAAEFVLYKLKEMEKITGEDISLVMEEFEELDVNQSGTLSVSDLALAQSSETREPASDWERTR
ncbi:Two-pore potassium channel 1 [Bienertia sinuspersici]